MVPMDEHFFGTKLFGGGDILLGYDDFVRLFDITSMDFAPGLQLRTDGVFVVPPLDDVDLAPEERATLTEHPTGNLKDPALPLPCRLSALEAFADFFGLRGAIEPFTMMQVTNKLTWTYLQSEARTEQGFHAKYFPISGLSALRRQLRQQHASEKSSDKWQVQREVLDALDSLLLPIDSADGDWDSPALSTVPAGNSPSEHRGSRSLTIPDTEALSHKPLSVKREKTLLRIIRALDVLAELPERGAATEIVAKLQGLEFQSPGDDTVRDVITQARNLEVD